MCELIVLENILKLGILWKFNGRSFQSAETTLSASLTIHAEGIETCVVGAELITNKWCRKFHHAHKVVVK